MASHLLGRQADFGAGHAHAVVRDVDLRSPDAEHPGLLG